MKEREGATSPRVLQRMPIEIKVKKCDEHVTGAAQIEWG